MLDLYYVSLCLRNHLDDTVQCSSKYPTAWLFIQDSPDIYQTIISNHFPQHIKRILAKYIQIHEVPAVENVDVCCNKTLELLGSKPWPVVTMTAVATGARELHEDLDNDQSVDVAE